MGLLCFNNYHCVNVPYNITVHITDDANLLAKNCWESVAGCAILNKKEIWIIDSQGGFKYKVATLYHELLHFEYYYYKNITGHPDELIHRDNAFRDSLGVNNRYLTKIEAENLKKNAKSKIFYKKIHK